MSSSGITLHNVAAFVPHPQDGRNVFSRLPLMVRQACNPGCQEKSLQTAGVEMRCNIGDGGGSISVHVAGTQPVRAELYLGDFLLWPFPLAPGKADIPLSATYTFPWLKGLHPQGQSASFLATIQPRRFDPRLVRILLPYRASVGPIKTRGALTPARADQVPPRTLLAYGSSITQGTESLAAGDAYAPRLARLLGLDLLNLGFGGSAHLEPEMATHIAQRQDWHAATLELGINLIGSLTPDAFAERARSFIHTIAAGQPTRPVFCLDLFRYFDDFPGGDAGRARAYRDAVRAAAGSAGAHVHHIPAHPLPSPAGLCADLLHPSPEGMEEMARALAQTIRTVLGS
jgi:lysophospholipase L1-like esterase